MKTQSKVAWDTLKAAFGSHKKLTEEYLKDPTPGADEKIERQFTQWTEQLDWPDETSSTGWYGHADTADECNARTEEFSTRRLWPFVKVIRYVHIR